MIERERAVAELELELARQTIELNSQRADLFRLQKRSADLMEANEHLVLATLAAQQLEAEARETKRRQDEFLAMLAHELRNPLAPLRSAVSLLASLQTVEPQIQVIQDVMSRQVGHMTRLLDDLLDTSRVISGKVTLQRRPMKVSEFLAQALELCHIQLETQRQQLTVNLPVEPLYVDGDPMRLTQIVGNLVHNASKYTPSGSAITLNVKAEGDWVVIKVADQGEGISQLALDRVFDLFAQEERSLDRSQGGLGVGLTVVRTMVELHGGTVKAHSEGIGMGSEFTVTLPRLSEPMEPIVDVETSQSFKPARVLLVDDNVDATTMLSMLFKRVGYEVEVAVDGQGALSSFTRLRPEIVICDIGLSDITGYEVAQYIRSSTQTMGSQSGKPPLLIALTGYASEKDQAQAMVAGFDHHLAKPATFKNLLKIIQST